MTQSSFYDESPFIAYDNTYLEYFLRFPFLELALEEELLLELERDLLCLLFFDLLLSELLDLDLDL